MKHATLCLLQRNAPHSEVLLGYKKRGFGAGKLVGVGGGVEAGETALIAAAREVSEEVHVWTSPDNLEHVARLAFVFPNRPAWDHYVEVYTLSAWRGDPQESDELAPVWFPIKDMPYAQMWPDAEIWLPEVLLGRRLFGVFVYAEDNAHIQEHWLMDWNPRLPSYPQLLRRHRLAYNQNAPARDQHPKSAWKVAERQRFFEALRIAKAHTLLEIGAGTGQDALFFQENGLDVTCTDVSTEMVSHCRAKGLQAHVMDFLSLDFEKGAFDALFGLNCVLHVPTPDLPRILAAFARILRPGALVYLGVYGGVSFEGVWEEDVLEPKRFFAYRSDETMQRFLSLYFDQIELRQVHVPNEPGHFQSIFMRRRG